MHLIGISHDTGLLQKESINSNPSIIQGSQLSLKSETRTTILSFMRVR